MPSLFEIIALITSGLLVGFVNTFAGGASVVSISLFMVLGLPPLQANIVNRIPIIMQTFTSSLIFYKKKMLDVKKGLKIGLPVVVGSVVGSFIAVEVNKEIFNYSMGFVLLLMLFFMFYQPDRWLHGNHELQNKMDLKIFGILFAIGIYGGFIHVGIGYLFLASFVLLLGFDIFEANALKNFIVLLYVPVTLLLFCLKGYVTLEMVSYGLIHGIGNVIGATLASLWAVKKGSNFLRYFMLVIILLTALNLFGIIDFGWLSRLLERA